MTFISKIFIIFADLNDCLNRVMADVKIKEKPKLSAFPEEVG
jgi:hypothetical protein